MVDAQTTEKIEAYAFRALVAHMRERADVSNIDQMNLAGFCRNCLAKWYLVGARKNGDAAMRYDDALERVYGEPYGDWKKKHQTKATDAQMESFEKNKHLHAKHDEAALRDPPPPAAAAAAPSENIPTTTTTTPSTSNAPTASPPPPPPLAARGGASSVCCEPADALAAAAAATASTSTATGGVPTSVRLGVVTVSDRAFDGEYEDVTGPALVCQMTAAAAEPKDPGGHGFTLFSHQRVVVPDDARKIAAAIKTLAASGCNLVLTTGGTGLSSRDVTPEATTSVLHKLAPGIPEAMHRAAVDRGVPHAMLSRSAAGVRDRCLVINLPGRPHAARDDLDVVMPVLAHAISQVSA